MSPVIRVRLKDKVSSRCSKDKLVRAPFLNHCALNNDERATSSRFPFTNARWRVRGRLTLMLAAAADATATPAPARQLWLVRTSPSACLSLPRARGGHRRLSNGFRAFQPFRLADDFRRGVRREKPRRYRSSTGKSKQPGVSVAHAAPSIGTLPPHRWPDSSALQPLHSLPHSATQITRDAFAHSDGRKLPRPAKTAVPQRFQAARLRPAKKSAIARDASHGQDIGITARGYACRRGRQQ